MEMHCLCKGEVMKYLFCFLLMLFCLACGGNNIPEVQNGQAVIFHSITTGNVYVCVIAQGSYLKCYPIAVPEPEVELVPEEPTVPNFEDRKSHQGVL